MDGFQKDLSPIRSGTVVEGQECTLRKAGQRLLRSLPPGACLSPVPSQTAVTEGQGRRERGEGWEGWSGAETGAELKPCFGFEMPKLLI